MMLRRQAAVVSFQLSERVDTGNKRNFGHAPGTQQIPNEEK